MVSTWFHVDRPGELDLALRLRVPDGKSTLKASLAGKALEIAVDGPEFHVVPLGKIQAKAAGYLRVDLNGVAKSGAVFAEISDLVVSSKTPEMKASFVRDNKGNMFYWGRRGPSVHLGYPLPKGKNIEYAYSELTVPKGEDALRLALARAADLPAGRKFRSVKKCPFPTAITGDGAFLSARMSHPHPQIPHTPQ